MRRRSARRLAEWLSRLLEEGGRLVLYGPPGSFRTRLALAVASRLRPAAYLGAGRHARLGELPPGVEGLSTSSFYEELLNVIRALGMARRGMLRALVLDEFMANLVPYRAVLNESYIMRMALAEVHVLRLVAEAGGRVLLVCGEDPRTGGPLGARYVRLLKPVLVRLEAVEGSLVVEERDLADPTLILGRAEAALEEVEAELP